MRVLTKASTGSGPKILTPTGNTVVDAVNQGVNNSGDYWGKGLVDAAGGVAQAIGGAALGVGQAIADTTVKPMAEATAEVGAAGLAGVKGSAAYASAFNPLDFHPEQAGDRQQKAITEPIDLFGKNINPIRAGADGKVDIGETLKQAGGVVLKGIGGAVNTASLGSSGIATKFIPQFIGGAAQASGQAIGEGKDLQTVATEGAVGGLVQGAAGKVVGAIGGALEKSALKSFLKPIDFTKTQAGDIGQSGLENLAKFIEQAKPNPMEGKAGLQSIVKKGVKSTGGKIDQMVLDANNSGQFQGTPIEKMVMSALNKTVTPQGMAGIKASADEIPTAMQKVREVAQFYMGKYADKPLDLLDQQALKTGIKVAHNSYGMGAVDSAANVFRKNLQGEARQVLENSIDGIANKNELYNALKSAAIRMSKVGKNAGYLTNTIAGGQGAMTGAVADSAKQIAQGKFDLGELLTATVAGGLLGVAAKKALNSDFAAILAGRVSSVSAKTLKLISPVIAQQAAKTTTGE